MTPTPSWMRPRRCLPAALVVGLLAATAQPLAAYTADPAAERARLEAFLAWAIQRLETLLAQVRDGQGAATTPGLGVSPGQAQAELAGSVVTTGGGVLGNGDGSSALPGSSAPAGGSSSAGAATGSGAAVASGAGASGSATSGAGAASGSDFDGGGFLGQGADEGSSSNAPVQVAASGSSGGGGPVPGPLGEIQGALGKPLPSNAEEVTPEVAHHILDALGYFQKETFKGSAFGTMVWIPLDAGLRNNNRFITRSSIPGVPAERVADYQRALRAIAHGSSYKWPQQNVTLDTRVGAVGRVRDVLFASAGRLAAAFRAHAQTPNMVTYLPEYEGVEPTDPAFAQAAGALNFPAGLGISLAGHEKNALLRAMAYKESSGGHWVGHRMRASYSGEAGWLQQLYYDRHGPGNTSARELNEYLPAENLLGAVHDLHQKAGLERSRRGQAALKAVLARYNAGQASSSRGQAYATSVISRQRRILAGLHPWDGSRRRAPEGARRLGEGPASAD